MHKIQLKMADRAKLIVNLDLIKYWNKLENLI